MQYSTNAKPVEHAGCQIYERIPGYVWDVVRDGQCMTQMAGMNGAKLAAEKIGALREAVDAMVPMTEAA